MLEVNLESVWWPGPQLDAMVAENPAKIMRDKIYCVDFVPIILLTSGVSWACVNFTE